MAETKHAHVDPVEGDGINYGGIFWFVVILVVTVLFCEVFVWAGFKFVLMPHRTVQGQPAPLAEPRTHPEIKDGRLMTGAVTPPTPGLNVQEPVVLKIRSPWSAATRGPFIISTTVVSSAVGQTKLTRILCGASSRASDLQSPARPCFAAA